MYFHYFAFFFPWKGMWPCNGTILDFRLKDDLCQAWLKLVQWFCRKRFLNCCKCIFIMLVSLDIGKCALRILFIQECFLPSSVESGQVVMELFLRLVNIVSLCPHHLLLEKGVALYENKYPNALC